MDDPEDEEKLVKLLSQGRIRGRILVVFDPGSGLGGSVRSFGDIRVAYAPRGALVVSSDGRLRSQARALGARSSGDGDLWRRSSE